MELYRNLMKATNAVDGNIQASFEDADRDNDIDFEIKEHLVGRCEECGNMVALRQLDRNAGACDRCARGC